MHALQASDEIRADQMPFQSRAPVCRDVPLAVPWDWDVAHQFVDTVNDHPIAY